MKRRDFFSKAIKTGVGLSILSGGVLASQSKKEPRLPFPYVKLDPEKIARRAYVYYRRHHCAYAVFASILEELKSKVGDPYTCIPAELFVYGRGGVVGWGTLCGALNGAGAILTLTCPDYKKLIDALYQWYQTTPLPIFVPEGSKPLPRSVSHSPLCHMSVQRWCRTASECMKRKVAYNSKERSERCARISADVAGKVVSLLNEYYAGRCASVKLRSAEKTKMDCSLCHREGEI